MRQYDTARSIDEAATKREGIFRIENFVRSLRIRIDRTLFTKIRIFRQPIRLLNSAPHHFHWALVLLVNWDQVHISLESDQVDPLPIFTHCNDVEAVQHWTWTLSWQTPVCREPHRVSEAREAHVSIKPAGNLTLTFFPAVFSLVHSFWVVFLSLRCLLLWFWVVLLCYEACDACVSACADTQEDRHRRLAAVCPWHITSSNCHTSLPAPVIHHSLLWRIHIRYAVCVWDCEAVWVCVIQTVGLPHKPLASYGYMPLSRTIAIKFTGKIDMATREIKKTIYRFRCERIEWVGDRATVMKKNYSFQIKSLYCRRRWRALDLAFFSFFPQLSLLLGLLCFAHPFVVLAFPSTRFLRRYFVHFGTLQKFFWSSSVFKSRQP